MRSDACLPLPDKDSVDALLVPDDVLLAVREAFELHRQRQRPLFPMTGLALQDLTVRRLIFQKAPAAGAGASVAWP